MQYIKNFNKRELSSAECTHNHFNSEQETGKQDFNNEFMAVTLFYRHIRRVIVLIIITVWCNCN